jgi:hypothetical protein
LIARQRLSKHATEAANKQATIEVLLNYNNKSGVFRGSASRLFNEDPRPAKLDLKKN